MRQWQVCQIPEVLTFNVVLLWVRMYAHSVHSLCIQRVVCWSRFLYAFERCCPCFLFLALVSVFCLTLAIFLSSAVGNCSSRLPLFFFGFYFIFLNLFPCPTKHERDWQPCAVLFSVCEYGWDPIEHNMTSVISRPL